MKKKPKPKRNYKATDLTRINLDALKRRVVELGESITFVTMQQRAQRHSIERLQEWIRASISFKYKKRAKRK